MGHYMFRSARQGPTNQGGQIRTPAAVDIGASGVKVCQWEIPAQPGAIPRANWAMAGLKEDSVLDGVIVDRRAVVAALRNALRRARIRERRAVLSASGQAVSVRPISLPPMSEAEVAGAVRWEFSRFLPYPAEEAIIDYVVIPPTGPSPPAPVLGEAPPPGSQEADEDALSVGLSAGSAAPGAPPQAASSAGGWQLVAVAVPRQVVDALLEVALDAGLDPVAIDILPLAHARLALNSRFDTGLRLHPAMPLGTPEVVSAPDAANGREGASAPDAAGARHAARTGIGIALDAPPAAASQEGSRLDRGMPAAYGPASNPASYLRQRNVCLVDLGASGTAVSIYRHGWLSVYRHLPQGGAALTAQIARSLNVDVARAEALKMDPPDRHELLHAAAPLLEDLVAELRRSINYYRAQYRWTEVDLMLLFGGGALMPGLDSYLARETGIPTQVYSSPLFPVNAAGAAGLALWVPADAPETASGAAAPGASVPDGTAVAAGGGVAPSYAGHGQPGAGNSGA